MSLGLKEIKSCGPITTFIFTQTSSKIYTALRVKSKYSYFVQMNILSASAYSASSNVFYTIEL